MPPSIPSPKDVFSKALTAFAGKPVTEAFDDKDVAGLLPMLGDANDDGTIDVRFVPIIKSPMGGGLSALPAIGPFNIPVSEAARMLTMLVAIAPPQAKPLVGAAVGGIIGAVGGIEKLLTE